MPPTVLFVCTGNICRSPMAAALLAAGLPPAGPSGSGDGVQVASAGTRALVGAPLDPHAERALREAGTPVPGVPARQLTGELVREADLVLAASREHRAAAVTLAPARARVAYTIREFGRLAAAVPPEEIEPVAVADRLLALRDRASLRRGTLPVLADPAGEDIPDPYRRGQVAFDEVLGLLVAALNPVLARLSAAPLSPERRD